MSAQTPKTVEVLSTIATGDPRWSQTGVYDVSRWKPIKAERYLEQMSQAGYTLELGGDLRLSCETLPDMRQRQVVWAEVRPHDYQGVTAVEPYLMTLYEVEDGRLFAFERSDVELVLADGSREMDDQRPAKRR